MPKTRRGTKRYKNRNQILKRSVNRHVRNGDFELALSQAADLIGQRPDDVSGMLRGLTPRARFVLLQEPRYEQAWR